MSSKQFNLFLILVQSVILISTFIGCAPKQDKGFVPVPETMRASQLWSRFQNTHTSYKQVPKGFRVKGNIDVSTPKQDSRMSYVFWGNYSYPLRIDLQAGLGTTFALWRITDKQWMAYLPGQKTAYTHSDAAIGTAKLGFPMPFSFQKLAFVLNGYWKEIIPRNYTRAEYISSEKCWKFFFSSRDRVHSLKLDKNAYPIEITGEKPFYWNVSLQKYFRGNKNAIPQKLVLDINHKYRSLLQTTDVDSRNKTWSTQSLELKLPENTRTVSLQEQYPQTN